MLRSRTQAGLHPGEDAYASRSRKPWIFKKTGACLWILLRRTQDETESTIVMQTALTSRPTFLRGIASDYLERLIMWGPSVRNMQVYFHEDTR